MLKAPDINLDDLVQQIYTIYPHFPCDDEQATIELRRKLSEQLLDKIPQVELEQPDLTCIIMNVKKSLSEFQRRIDESVAQQQQLRRTTRIRRTVYQDPAVIHFFNPGNKLERKSDSSTIIKEKPACTNIQCNHQVSDLGGLVQVESLPVSATTNLVTIFVPSILQEKLHSCKYKISIDLNRLDLTKKILDLNVGQQLNSKFETDTKVHSIRAIENGTDEKGDNNQITYEVKNTFESLTTVAVVEGNPEMEIKTSADTPPAMESTVSILTDTAVQPATKKTKQKRKQQKPLSNNPPKKRGRKLGSKNKKKDQKSELAKYVEMFTCNVGSPSAISQIVTSTTQNWDISPEQNGQIAYFMDGEWTLNAPSKSSSQLVSTSNGASLDQANGSGQETYIPFEDFVNFIDNPSLDAGSNVIAQVLEGTVDTAQGSANSQEIESVLNLSVEMPKTSKSGENILAIHQQKPSTSKSMAEKTKESYNRCNVNSVHSTPNNREMSANNGVLDLSKECSISFNVDILDLTRNKDDTKATSSVDKAEHCTPATNGEEKNVIFSISRSMPSLDDVESELFCYTPKRSENMQKNIIFSTAPANGNKSLHSLEEDSITDSAIEVERNGTSRDSSLELAEYSKNASSPALKDKSKAEVTRGMSLLEIEKDIDDSLLDFDDLLSLAPSSCFNSPNEDRFADSNFPNIDESNTKTSTSNSTTPAPRSHLELDFFKTKEDEPNPALKNFKIPRMKQLNNGGSSSELTPFACDQESSTPNFNVSSDCSEGGRRKIKSSVHTSITMDTSVNANSSSEIDSTQEISMIFGSLCYGFLADKCFEANCKLSHQLLELSVVITSLTLARNEILHSAYRFIWRHHKLFRFYFTIFCDEYGRRNMRRKLSNMISDCEIQPNCVPYLRNIYAALICCGLNRINACRFILNRAKERSHAAIDILLEIIIESEAAMFATIIEEFSDIADYKFRMKDINALATACLRSGSAQLTTALIKCLINVDQTEFATMRSPELIQLLELVKDGGIDGL